MANESKYLLGEDYITNDVNQIEQSKSVEGLKNYNIGRVKLKCFINRYCPVLKGQHANYGIIFNHNTIASIPESVLKNFDFVPGIEGLFLRPKFNYRSTFLAYPVSVDVTESLSQDGVLSASTVESAINLTSGELNANNFFESVSDKIGKTERIEKYLDDLFDDLPLYVSHQTWVVVPSPIDGKKVPDESEFVCDTTCSKEESSARWKYITLPRSTENDGVDAKNTTPPNASTVNTAGANTRTDSLGAKGSFKQSSEPSDSFVLFPAQMASSPVEVRASESSENTSTIAESIHWRIKKKTPLFKGEDFFMEFRNISVEKDFKNMDTTANKFKDEGYKFLDVHNEGDYSGTVVDGKYTGKYPENQALVTYKTITEEIQVGSDVDPAGELSDSVTESISFEKVEDSVKFFDFNKQPYLILEMKGDGGHYFFVFAEKANPICFKVVDVKGSKVGFLLSTYKKISCRSLFRETGFTFSVRNHLGKIVITFLGAEDIPWVIENPGAVSAVSMAGELAEENKSKEDNIFRVPDKCELYLWGGNYAVAFSFNPLQYNTSANISLPPGTNSEDNSNDKSSVFTVSDMGIGSHHMVLSSSDMIPKKFDTKAEYKRVRYAVSGTSEEVGEDLYLKTRNQFYTCDAHWITEVGFKRGENTPISYDSGYDKDSPSTFTNTGDYIKDSNDNAGIPDFDQREAGESAGYLEFPSSITIESKALTSALGEMDSGLGVSSKELEKNNENLKSFSIDVNLSAGSYTFKGTDREFHWTLNDCITPVITNTRLNSIPLEEGAWTPKGDGIDVSKHVLKFNDSWTSQDFYTAEHSGSMSFIINDTVNDLPYSEELEEMKDKAFYVEVWAGYDNCSYTFGAVDDGDKTPLFYKLFTGICFGGTVTQEPLIRTMECKIVDYSKILKDTLFFNSPFFDGMRDANAVYEILKIAGFKETGKGTGKKDDGDGIFGVCDPASEVSSSCKNDGGYISKTLDGRAYTYSEYALPFSYDRIQNPFFRFKDGSNLYDAIVGFAKRASKMVFFDAFGVFHYQDSMGIKMASLTNEELGKYALWKFRTSETSDSEGGKPTAWQYVFSSMTKEGSVEDVYNNIHMMTSTPRFEVIIGDRINWDSVTDPSVRGFLGYKRTMLQVESAFGNADTLKNIMEYYKAVWVPPLVYSFETYGQPLRIFDVVSLDDNNMLVTSVSSDIDPQANKWNQTVEGEYFGKSVTVEKKEGTNRDNENNIEDNVDGAGEITPSGHGKINFDGKTYEYVDGTTRAVM